MLNNLKGFTFIKPQIDAKITLDKYHRFYLSEGTMDIIGLEPKDTVRIAYNSDTKELALIKSGNFTIDSRNYINAKYFCMRYRYDGGASFVYKERIGDAFIFRLDT